MEKIEAALVIDLNKAKSSPLSSHVDDEKWLVDIETSPSSKSLKPPIIIKSLKRSNED